MNIDNKNIISVVVPCYNSEDYLAETLDSVLAQTCIDWECIIVNDGSTDDSLRIAQEYVEKDKRFKVIDKKNEGPAIARNVGITNASGKYILPLDSDDKIAPTYLEKACSYLEKHPEIKLVYCEADFFGIKEEHWILDEYDFSNLPWKNCIFCSFIFRRTDFYKTSGYNPNMENIEEDWDFLLSLLKEEDMVYKIPEVLFFYRRRYGSRSKSDHETLFKSHLQLILNHPKLYAKDVDRTVAWLDEVPFYKEQLQDILKSRSFRLGYALLYPLRLIKNCFH